MSSDQRIVGLFGLESILTRCRARLPKTKVNTGKHNGLQIHLDEGALD